MATTRHRYPNVAALVADYEARGWTDGLPIVPPTPDAVAEMMQGCDLDGGDVIGTVPSWSASVTAENLAINAVMAGCLPTYMPTLVAVVQALTAPEANCHSTLATTNNPAQFVVLNGPVRDELGVRCGVGVLDPTTRASATIGRAVGLVVRNVLGVLPGELDQSVFSIPGRHGVVFGENEGEAGWPPLAEERGVPAGASAVTVFAGYPPIVHRPRYELDADGLAASFVDKVYDCTGVWGASTPGRDLMVLVGQEHQRLLADAGWTKATFRSRLYEALSELAGKPGSREQHEPCLLAGPDDIAVVAAGGSGNPISLIITAHAGRAVTRRVSSPERSAP